MKQKANSKANEKKKFIKRGNQKFILMGKHKTERETENKGNGYF